MAETALDSLYRRLQWFLLARLGIATCLLGATVLLYYRTLSGTSAAAGRLLLWILAGTYCFSLLSGILLAQVRNLSFFAYSQIVFDTLFVSCTILLTGGLESPFPFLYHLAILNAALLLFRPGALWAATLAAFCYGGMVTLLYYGLLSPVSFHAAAVSSLDPLLGFPVLVQLVVHVTSFYVIAILGSYLTHRLCHTESLLDERDQALGRLSSLYQGVIQNLESGVLITDLGGHVEYANGPMGEIFNAPPDRLIGRKVADLLPALSTYQPSSPPCEFPFRECEGASERILRATCSTLCDTYGNSIGLLYNIQDITGVKALEQELKEAEASEGISLQNSGPAVDSFAGLVGCSEGMNRVYQLIRKVAESTTTVLITGESGTGKELVARAIHDTGPRAQRPFVPVNCGAIPESLIESELFGYLKGAFTGATTTRLGLFREADGGTIFLDEIGELSLPLQVKLLRVLQEHEVTPIGASKGVPIDVRVLAATNKNLEEEVAAGRFREDLFYRLNVIRIALPPLRERRGDLPLLIHHFLSRFAAASGRTIRQISPQAMRILLDHSYPGNIRELENIIQYAVTMAEEDTIRTTDLPPYLHQHSPQQPSPTALDPGQANGFSLDFFRKGVSLDAELEEYEQRILRAALEKAGGVQKKAAEVLGINYRSLRHRLQKYRLS
ncbi:MAG: sigma-54-dependent Fis family transcriptional regulator [Candidatus Binatia bacterium]|nr:sigma-54-dependent Fis family transcriptional regulator [Candidatus Binatia bacterium]